MYLCAICKQPSPPGQTRLVHRVYRELPTPTRMEPDRKRREIAAELPVCVDCASSLAAGTPLASLKKRHARPTPITILNAPDRQLAVAEQGRSILRRS